MRLSTPRSTKMIYLNIDMYCSQSISTRRHQEADYWLNMNGDPLGYNNREGGFIMKCISQNLSFFYFVDLLELTQPVDYLLKATPLLSNIPCRWMHKLSSDRIYAFSFQSFWRVLGYRLILVQFTISLRNRNWLKMGFIT
jgi:hypothetical protein